MLKKVSDARFQEVLSTAKREFPFCLEDMEKEGELNLDFVRYRTANELFEVTRKAGDYLATNFDCGSAKEAQSKFNEMVDGLANYISSVVMQMRERTAVLDEETLNGLETDIKRVVKRKRNRNRDAYNG